jgi:predicted LPLAT superfamily acyltransferase
MPVFFMTGLYTGPCKYEVFIEPLAYFTEVEKEGKEAALQQALTNYVGLLDKYCHMAPYNWFNFFDFWQ